MDELAEARAALEMRGRQLLDAHEATVALKRKIDELIRAMPSAINRLPTELLAKIIDLSIDYLQDDLRCGLLRSQELAGVSRRWREVILGIPYFWTTIKVSCRRRRIPSVETQLARTRGAALDVILEDSPYESDRWPGLVHHRHDLDLVVSCANRWRSLEYCNECRNNTVADKIVDAFKRLEFPLLRYINLRNFYSGITSLFSANTPALEHLVLDRFIALSQVLPVAWFTRLKTLALDASGSLFLPVPLHAQSLTTLSLASHDSSRSLLPKDSIICPVLQRLVLRVHHPRVFLEAIVAPNLEDFDISVPFSGCMHPNLFSCLVFRRVTRLSFSARVHEDVGIDAETFPNVREVAIDASRCSFSCIFDPISGSNNAICDYWEKLETLTYKLGTPFYIDPLVSWLTKRHESGRPKLHVKLIGIVARDGPELRRTCILLDILRKYCTVELDGAELHLVTLLSGSSSPLQTASSDITSDLMNDIGLSFVCKHLGINRNH